LGDIGEIHRLERLVLNPTSAWKIGLESTIASVTQVDV
jgi:hypothetical protein